MNASKLCRYVRVTYCKHLPYFFLYELLQINELKNNLNKMFEITQKVPRQQFDFDSYMFAHILVNQT